MKTDLECLPCFLKQAIDIGKSALDNEADQQQLVKDVAKMIHEFPMNFTPPEMARDIYNLLEKKLGFRDFYRSEKQISNQMALNFYPQLKERIENSMNRFLTAVEIAIAGNVIDYGARNSLDIDAEVDKLFQGIEMTNDKTIFQYDEFVEDIQASQKIIYLGDNSGEIVFDRVLIEELVAMGKDVTFVVREKPIINDVLMEDAIFAGIDKVVPVISSGSDAPGTILKYCTPEFRDIFSQADLIISKGQGNYETLNMEDFPIYFLLKAKCSVIAKYAGAKVGDIVLKRCISKSFLTQIV